jgi:hypothetical protein
MHALKSTGAAEVGAEVVAPLVVGEVVVLLFPRSPHAVNASAAKAATIAIRAVFFTAPPEYLKISMRQPHGTHGANRGTPSTLVGCPYSRVGKW